MRRRILTTAGTITVVLAAVLAGASPIHADETPLSELVIGYPPSCDDAEAATLSAVDCAGIEPVDAIGPIAPEIEAAAAETARIETALVAAEGPEALRKNCRFHAEVAALHGEDWNRLAQTLAAEASHCADYYISVPAPAGNKTMPARRPSVAHSRARPTVSCHGRSTSDGLAVVGDREQQDLDGSGQGVPPTDGCGRIRRLPG